MAAFQKILKILLLLLLNLNVPLLIILWNSFFLKSCFFSWAAPTASCFCCIPLRKIRNHLLVQQSPCSRYIWFFLINNFDSLKDTSCWECYYTEVNLMCEAVSVLVLFSFFLSFLFIYFWSDLCDCFYGSSWTHGRWSWTVRWRWRTLTAGQKSCAWEIVLGCHQPWRKNTWKVSWRPK